MTNANAPCLVAIDMGYGHLRPARALSRVLGVPVLHADRPPLADFEEQKKWNRTRHFYETVTRISTHSVFGAPFGALLKTITAIPEIYPLRDLSSRTVGVRLLEHMARDGLGRSLVSYLQERNAPLLTTFYSPAVLADYHGYDQVFCVVTDADVNRIWAPIDPKHSKIRYFAPSGRVVRRLRSYGVSPEHIQLTGYPLPHSLVGGPELSTLIANLLPRLARLDPQGIFREQYAAELGALGPLPSTSAPPHLVFAVGGAGAQADLPGKFLPSLRPLLAEGRLKLTLVAGVRHEVKRLFDVALNRTRLAGELGRSVAVLYEPDVETYLDKFDQLLASTDVLWTKPSELTLYGGLGIALVLAPPVGEHEKYNRSWARENGAGLKQRDPHTAADWLTDWLNDGTLAATAWAGHKRLPSRGLYRIVESMNAALVGAESAPHSATQNGRSLVL